MIISNYWQVINNGLRKDMEKNDKKIDEAMPEPAQKPEKPSVPPETTARPPEFGGPQGPEPTRYGDWERNGRVSDF